MSDIGFRIKSLRKHHNLSQKEFAEAVFITQSYLSRIELGKEDPTDMLLKLITYEFNCSWEWLKNGEERNINDSNLSNSYSTKEYMESLKLDAIEICTFILNYLIKSKYSYSDPKVYENIFLSLSTIMYCLKSDKKHMDEISISWLAKVCQLFLSVLDNSFHNIQSSELIDRTCKDIKEIFEELENTCRSFSTETIDF